MRSFRLDPYLWVHLAGLAAVPLWLDICLLGLATGDPVLPVWTELGLVGALGSLPVVWMQWQKPFSIFSLVLLALRPDRMSDDRRRILRLFKDPIVKFLAALAPIPLIWALSRLYTLSPLVADLSPFTAGGRGLGLLVAAIAFLLANLFVQVPLSVLRVLATPQRVFDKLPPYAAEQIKQDFTLLGFRVNRILPDWQAESSAPAAPSPETVLAAPSRAAVPTLEEDLEDWEDAVEAAAALSTADLPAVDTTPAMVEAESDFLETDPVDVGAAEVAAATAGAVGESDLAEPEPAAADLADPGISATLAEVELAQADAAEDSIGETEPADATAEPELAEPEPGPTEVIDMVARTEFAAPEPGAAEPAAAEIPGAAVEAVLAGDPQARGAATVDPDAVADAEAEPTLEPEPTPAAESVASGADGLAEPQAMPESDSAQRADTPSAASDVDPSEASLEASTHWQGAEADDLSQGAESNSVSETLDSSEPSWKS
jgi:hypothetical protein